MHMLPRSSLRSPALGMAAALTVMAAAAAPAQADPQLSIGLQAAGVNGGAITMEAPSSPDNAYGTFSQGTESRLTPKRAQDLEQVLGIICGALTAPLD